MVSIYYDADPDYRRYEQKLFNSVKSSVDVDMILVTSSRGPVGQWKLCRATPELSPAEQALTRASRRAYDKLISWNLTEYEAVLFIDLDTLVIGDIAPLFETWPGILRSAGMSLAAATDQPYHWSFRWTAAGDRFNSGVMLLLPDVQTFQWLERGLHFIKYDQFQMGEQSYLNIALSRQRMELPGTYNAMITTAYSEPYVWAGFLAKGIDIVHFTYPKAHKRELCDQHFVLGICKLWLDWKT